MKMVRAMTANVVPRTPMSRAVDFTHANRLLIRNMRRTTAAPKLHPRVLGLSYYNP
jgi:hypothetical protein